MWWNDKPNSGIDITCISDTHEQHDQIPAHNLKGDVLIHAGDFTYTGEIAKICEFNEWLGSLDFKIKIVIAGNHELLFEENPTLARSLITNAVYLEDQIYKIPNTRHVIYGSPWQPRFGDWAFNVNRGSAIREKWARIPEDTTILVTHGPPHGTLDKLERGEHVGCEDLRDRIKQLPNLEAHIFGHVHSGYGLKQKERKIIYANSSICNEDYQPVNKPWTIRL